MQRSNHPFTTLFMITWILLEYKNYIQSDKKITCISRCTRTLISLKTSQRTCSTIQTRSSITRVGNRDFTKRSTKSQWTHAGKARRCSRRYFNLTRATILASRSWSCMARVKMLTVFTHVFWCTTVTKNKYQSNQSLVVFDLSSTQWLMIMVSQ